MTRRPPGWRGAALAVTLVVAGWHGGHAAWIEAKARLAQHLIGRAWQRERTGPGDVPPWPWADTHPVARLLVPGQDVDLMVLAGASGRTLAFGPGHVTATPLPGEDGNAVVSGHRDTHFAFLPRLRAGDEVVVEGRTGERRRYVVRRAFVVDHRETWVAEDAGDTRLTLVTCYPFDALRPGGPLRYVVSARLDEQGLHDSSRLPGAPRGARGEVPESSVGRSRSGETARTRRAVSSARAVSGRRR